MSLIHTLGNKLFNIILMSQIREKARRQDSIAHFFIFQSCISTCVYEGRQGG